MWRNAQEILLSTAIPAWAVLVVIAVHLWRHGPNYMERWNERRRDAAVEKAADWSRLREEVHELRSRLNEEIDRAKRQREEQEEENNRCRHELHVVRAQMAQEIAARIKLQAFIDGQGEVRQAGAVAAAEARLDAIEAEKKKGGK